MCVEISKTKDPDSIFHYSEKARALTTYTYPTGVYLTIQNHTGLYEISSLSQIQVLCNYLMYVYSNVHVHLLCIVYLTVTKLKS